MLNDTKIISIYCIVDDLLKGLRHYEPPRRKVSDAELITTVLVSALYFGGHWDHGRNFMKMTGMVPQMLDKSRFCRRLHQIEPLLCQLFFQLGHCLKMFAGADDYVIDSFPVAVCDNMRISRCRMLQGKQWRGRHSSMRRYFYGVKVQVLTTSSGIPIEFCFVPGSENDVQALKKLPMAVAPESNIFADSAYTDYLAEDDSREADGIKLMVHRKSNSKRPDKSHIVYLKNHMRKRIETTFSAIKALFLRKIHAVTFKGFLLKIVAFLFANTINEIA
ncbi:IS982 family transposase [Chitinophagaceae bacterium MMS25-I14]